MKITLKKSIGSNIPGGRVRLGVLDENGNDRTPAEILGPLVWVMGQVLGIIWKLWK